MKTHHVLLMVLVVGASGLNSYGQGQVSTPAKRQVSLDVASRLLAPRQNPILSLPGGLVNPFNSGSSRKAGVSGHAGGTDREILANIAAHITPSGAMMFGGEPILLLGEKKLKVGDSLTIPFEGTDYLVVIAEISQSSFKVRFNREEITRPIKPGKVP